MNEKIESIINIYKNIDKENIYNKNSINILNDFINQLNNEKECLKDVLNNDNKKWGYGYSLEKTYDIINNNNLEEKNINKDKITVSIGNIFVISNGDPYVTVSLIIKALKSNSSIVFINRYEMFNINEYIIQIADDILKKYNLYEKLISIIDLPNYKELSDYDDFIDCIVVVKDYDAYTYFVNKVTCKLIYSDYGNINIYTDTNDYDSDINYIVEEAKRENKDAFFYKIDNIEDFFKYETNNFIFNTVVIYTKNVKECVNFFKKIKSRNVYINLNPLKYTDIDIDVNQFQYTKRVIYK